MNRHTKFSWILTLLIAALTLSACQTASTSKATAPLPPAGVIAQGHVEPSAYVDVSFTVPGRVTEILVAEGESITAGQVLARLSGSEARTADLARAGQELLSAQQALADLQANPELVSAQTASAVVDFEKALSDTRDQLDTLQNPKPSLVAQTEARIALLEQQLVDAQGKLQDIQGQTDPNALKLAQAESAVADIQTALDDARTGLDTLKKPDALLISQLDAHITSLEEQLVRAKSNAEILKAGADPNDLALAQARLDTAQAAVVSAESAAASLELRAPMQGIVVGLNLKVGQFIPAGQAALTLADISKWVVKTDDLTELEVVEVQPGQTVQVILDALPDSPLNGKVIAIQQRFEDRRGDVTYTVTIDVDKPAEGMRWGMSGQVSFSQQDK